MESAIKTILSENLKVSSSEYISIKTLIESNKIAKEYDVYELGCKLGMLNGETEFAYFCLAHLEKEINNPDSKRIQLLIGMLLEHNKEYVAAEKHYKAMILNHPQFLPAYKRIIVIIRETLGIREAINECCRVLELFPGDIEGWRELCYYYQELGMLNEALHASLEVVLLNPEDETGFNLCGQIYVSQATNESYLLARKYYSHAVTLNDTNTNSIIGLKRACEKLISAAGSCEVSSRLIILADSLMIRNNGIKTE